MGCENDVVYLTDGEIASFHDDNMEAMTGHNVEIEDCSWSEIQNYTYF